MSAAGPALPPHLLAKRKRQQEEEEQNDHSTASGAKRSKSPEDGEKRRRVIGPAMPPAPLDERPSEPPNQVEESDSDDDEDGFGPAPPPEDGDDGANDAHQDKEPQATARSPTPEAKPQRDAWMTMAPQQDDLAARMDPTRQRPRGFNTGKGAKGPTGGVADATAWHETAEQKQKRLADEMMGISHAPTATAGPQRPPGKEGDGDAATARQVQPSRGPSLMEQHKVGKGKEAEDDDPSRRAFDREKDMGAGMRIGHKQREEMLKKAGGFSGKFAGGSYL